MDLKDDFKKDIYYSLNSIRIEELFKYFVTDYYKLLSEKAITKEDIKKLIPEMENICNEKISILKEFKSDCKFLLEFYSK